MELRNDEGALWENLMMVERRKLHANTGRFVQQYFWRTTQQKEIDLIEEYDGQLSAYEFKWKAGKTVKVPTAFKEAYPNASFQSVNPDNFQEFVNGTNDR